MVQLSNNVKVQRNEFKGIDYIHVRRYYIDKEGEEKPGKGIAFTVEEWDEFKDRFEEISEV